MAGNGFVGDVIAKAPNIAPRRMCLRVADEKDVSLPLGLRVFVVACEREGGGQQKETDCDTYFTPLTSHTSLGCHRCQQHLIQTEYFSLFAVQQKNVFIKDSKKVYCMHLKFATVQHVSEETAIVDLVCMRTKLCKWSAFCV